MDTSAAARIVAAPAPATIITTTMGFIHGHLAVLRLLFGQEAQQNVPVAREGLAPTSEDLSSQAAEIGAEPLLLGKPAANMGLVFCDGFFPAASLADLEGIRPRGISVGKSDLVDEDDSAAADIDMAAACTPCTQVVECGADVFHLYIDHCCRQPLRRML
jgi:hypothetical protein